MNENLIRAAKAKYFTELNAVLEIGIKLSKILLLASMAFGYVELYNYLNEYGLAYKFHSIAGSVDVFVMAAVFSVLITLSTILMVFGANYFYFEAVSDPSRDSNGVWVDFLMILSALCVTFVFTMLEKDAITLLLMIGLFASVWAFLHVNFVIEKHFERNKEIERDKTLPLRDELLSAYGVGTKKASFILLTLYCFILIIPLFGLGKAVDALGFDGVLSWVMLALLGIGYSFMSALIVNARDLVAAMVFLAVLVFVTVGLYKNKIGDAVATRTGVGNYYSTLVIKNIYLDDVKNIEGLDKIGCKKAAGGYTRVCNAFVVADLQNEIVISTSHELARKQNYMLVKKEDILTEIRVK